MSKIDEMVIIRIEGLNLDNKIKIINIIYANNKENAHIWFKYFNCFRNNLFYFF